MTNQLDVPVAYIFFNRPSHTRASFESIRKVRPTKLYLIRDAARDGHVQDAERIDQSTQIAERIDWPCEVTRIYAETNLGCGRRISTGIDTAFESTERLIILEDDCVAHRDFYDFCRRMLDRYVSETDVMSIGGNNFQIAGGGDRIATGDHYFSKYAHIWGWATWRSAWAQYDFSMSDWPGFYHRGGLHELSRHRHEREYWRSMFDKVQAGLIDTWDFQWMFACWRAGGRSVVPAVNLVQNIGFDEDGSRTTAAMAHFSLATESLPVSKDKHAIDPDIDRAADAITDQFYYSGNLSPPGLWKRLTRRLSGRQPYGQPIDCGSSRPCDGGGIVV